MTGAVVLVELEPPAVIVCMAPVVAAAVSEIKAIKNFKDYHRKFISQKIYTRNKMKTHHSGINSQHCTMISVSSPTK